MKTIRVAGAQINLRVGDLAHNEARIRDAMSWAEAEGAGVLLLPELAIPGYPPEDNVLRRLADHYEVEARNRDERAEHLADWE